MISVVLPVRDEERLVGRAVRSILAQTWRDFELIVVDNGSTDGSRAAVDEAAQGDPRLRIVAEPVAGVSHARNRGLAHARHRWVAVQDADDVSHPRRLEILMSHLAARPGTVALGGWAIVYSERDGLREPFSHATTDRSIRFQLRCGPCPFVHSTVILDRDACLRVGGYPTGFTTCDDYALWALLQNEGRLGNLPMHLAVYRHQDRPPDSEFRARERAEMEELRRRFLRPPSRLSDWALQLTRRARSRRARRRMGRDWPPDLIRSVGLDDLLLPDLPGVASA